MTPEDRAAFEVAEANAQFGIFDLEDDRRFVVVNIAEDNMPIAVWGPYRSVIAASEAAEHIADRIDTMMAPLAAAVWKDRPPPPPTRCVVMALFVGIDTLDIVDQP